MTQAEDDAGLVSLAQEFDTRAEASQAAWDEYDQAQLLADDAKAAKEAAATRVERASRRHGQAMEHACAAQQRAYEIIERMADTPTCSIAGLKIKARAVAWAEGWKPDNGTIVRDHIDTVPAARLVASLIDDLLSMPNPPPTG